MNDTPVTVLVLPTPGGPLTVLLTPEDGVVRASGYTGVEDQVARLAPDLRRGGYRAVPPSDPVAGPVADAVAAYSAGRVDALADVPVAQPGGAFLQEVWRVMRAIPPGQTWSYAELAAKAGRPAAVRAAGQACARNLVAPFVPCHRVVRSDGTLGGYYYGLAVKERLLAHERAAG
ncbi:MAG TPA: methylated-DNA--[protein]-cysteine S-methyltransferase [Jiangellales bacterium]|nr:methylated-DNA--[protein]-cysteine S-methyltransferase [Jiangellales bacterium]